MSESETHVTETVTQVTETVSAVNPNRYARNDPATFAAGEETTPEKDAADRKEHPGTFAAGEETTPEKDAAERTHPGTFGDTEPTV